MFAMYSVMFSLASLVILGLIVVTAVRGILQWNKNNHAPRLTVPAAIVDKRTHVTTHHHTTAGGHHHHHLSTSYYVTFQVDSGDCMEFQVEGTEYGLLIQGTRGALSFQGTRFLGFTRENSGI